MNATRLVVAAILDAGVTGVAAQQPERAVFVVTPGRDMLAVENASLAREHLVLDESSGDFSGYGRLPSYHVRRDFLGALTDWLVLRL